MKRTPLGTALPLAREIIAYLAARAPAADLTPAGSVRRNEPTVGDIDIVCTSDEPDAVIALEANRRADELAFVVPGAAADDAIVRVCALEPR